MLTVRENYLIAVKGGKPEWVPSFASDTCVVPPFKFLGRDPETDANFYNIR